MMKAHKITKTWTKIKIKTENIKRKLIKNIGNPLQ